MFKHIWQSRKMRGDKRQPFIQITVLRTRIYILLSVSQQDHVVTFQSSVSHVWVQHLTVHCPPVTSGDSLLTPTVQWKKHMISKTYNTTIYEKTHSKTYNTTIYEKAHD